MNPALNYCTFPNIPKNPPINPKAEQIIMRPRITLITVFL